MLKQTSSTEKAEVQATVAAEMNMFGRRSIMISASAFVNRSGFGRFAFHRLPFPNG
jgi:hypothetical protein